MLSGAQNHTEILGWFLLAARDKSRWKGSGGIQVVLALGLPDLGKILHD